MNLDINVGSITNAQRGLRILRSHGYKPALKRIENPSQSDGCGYMLSLNADSDEPIRLLEKNKIKVIGVSSK